MIRRRVQAGLSDEEKRVIKRLELFAERNNLLLFNVKGSLYDRVKTITDSGGKCPCHPDTRTHCPCKECLQECRDNGECSCRVFMAKDWQEIWRERLGG